MFACTINWKKLLNEAFNVEENPILIKESGTRELAKGMTGNRENSNMISITTNRNMGKWLSLNARLC